MSLQNLDVCHEFRVYLTIRGVPEFRTMTEVELVNATQTIDASMEATMDDVLLEFACVKTTKLWRISCTVPRPAGNLNLDRQRTP